MLKITEKFALSSNLNFMKIKTSSFGFLIIYFELGKEMLFLNQKIITAKCLFHIYILCFIN